MKGHRRRIAIVGTVGVPASYGGFETLAENLALWHERTRRAGGRTERISIYCSGPSYQERRAEFHGAELVYVPLKANGSQSVLYDAWSILSALWRGADAVLVLGVSGAIILPLARLVGRAQIVTNIDGIEWRRGKFGRVERAILKGSEALAVRFSHNVVADNEAIADYVREAYGTECAVIAYGGDHSVAPEVRAPEGIELPPRYAFNVCRIEPENNVAMMLEAFECASLPLVCVGNWDRSAYGANLRRRYASNPNLHLLDPIYDTGVLKSLRSGAFVYVHGHSAGGTNPSLVEMMFFGVPVFAYDCGFNRYTTEGRALYFSTADELSEGVASTPPNRLIEVGEDMREIAERRYTWDAIGRDYFALLGSG